MRKRAEKSPRTADRDSSSTGPGILVIAPSRESPAQTELRRKLLAASDQSGLPILKTIRLQFLRVIGGEEKDRPFQLLDPEDAKLVYRQSHRNDIAVFAVGSGYVRRDPSTTPARRRQLLTIERFVRYKAFYGLIRSPKDIEHHLEQFKLTLTTVACDGPDDPRTLPLHIFNCTREWDGLDHIEEQRIFAQEHGFASRRLDCSEMSWTKPKGQAATHGGPPLRVARYVLQKGFHWDVSPTSSGTIYTPDAVWRLRQRSSYLNIYPDGYVRVAERTTGVTKVWPRSRG